jgi:hypothetical protein
MSWKRKFGGGALAAAGYMLSPLSWWNDTFVNLPLAYVFAWCASRFHRPAFGAALVIGYWLTNVLGFILMHKGAQTLAARAGRHYSRRDFVKDISVSLAYTALVIVLLKLHVLKPIEDYVQQQKILGSV